MFLYNRSDGGKDVVTCIVCQQVFCCATCREKHEQLRHDVNAVPLKNNCGWCPICEKQPLPLHPRLPTTLLRHIQLEHLPLQCQKCADIYETIEDLQMDGKCNRKNLKKMRKELLTNVLSAIPNQETTRDSINPNENDNDNNLTHDLIAVSNKDSKDKHLLDKSKNQRTFSSSVQYVEHHNPSSIKNKSDGATGSTGRKESFQSIAIQTSPLIGGGNYNNHITPLSVINMRWKCKGKSLSSNEEFISDSLSSIRNISAMNNTSERYNLCSITGNHNNNHENNRNNNGNNRGKIIRTTSTPVHIEVLFAKPKEPIYFNASSGTSQVSSIHNSGSYVSDEGHALLTTADNMANNILGGNLQNTVSRGDGIFGRKSGSPSHQVQRRKVANNGRIVKFTAVTPLRQVMSKSIQKAMVEHGGMPTSVVTNQHPIRHLCSANSSPESGNNPSALIEAFGQSEALDLRLSPVVRRAYQFERFRKEPINLQSPRNHNQPHHFTDNRNNTTNDIDNNINYHKSMEERAVILSSHKTTTESIVITRMEKMSAISMQDIHKNSNVVENIASGSNYGTAKSTDITKSMIPASSDSRKMDNDAFYKSCRHVEIISTRTELSNLNVIQTTSARIRHESRGAIRIQNIQANNLTPISSIPGAAIQKKLIKFETPKKRRSEEESHTEQQRIAQVQLTKANSNDADGRWTKVITPLSLSTKNSSVLNGTNNDIFYTPNTSISTKYNESGEASLCVENIDDDLNPDDCKTNRGANRMIPRKLNSQLSAIPKKNLDLLEGRRRAPPSFIECAQSTAYSQIEIDNNEGDDEHKDNSDSRVEKIYKIDNILPFIKQTEKNETPSNSGPIKNNANISSKNAGSIWSKMTSLIRFSTLQPSNSDTSNVHGNLNSNSTFMLKRCASLAGEKFLRLLHL